jgi:hypothetical protein
MLGLHAAAPGKPESCSLHQDLDACKKCPESGPQGPQPAPGPLMAWCLGGRPRALGSHAGMLGPAPAAGARPMRPVFNGAISARQWPLVEEGGGGSVARPRARDAWAPVQVEAAPGSGTSGPGPVAKRARNAQSTEAPCCMPWMDLWTRLALLGSGQQAQHATPLGLGPAPIQQLPSCLPEDSTDSCSTSASAAAPVCPGSRRSTDKDASSAFAAGAGVVPHSSSPASMRGRRSGPRESPRRCKSRTAAHAAA